MRTFKQFLFLTGSVLVQMIVCGIYGIVHKLQYPLSNELKNRVTRDKIDYILAFGEAVLNIGNEQPELANIKSMASDIINMESGYEFAIWDHPFKTSAFFFGGGGVGGEGS